MKNYFLKRLLNLIPVCFLLTAFAFILTMAIPGDAVDSILLRDEGISISAKDYKKQKEKIAHELGLNKPIFYFSVSSLAEAGTFTYFTNTKTKTAFNRLVHVTGNYFAVKNYFSCLSACDNAIQLLNEQNNFFHDSVSEKIHALQKTLHDLQFESDVNVILKKAALAQNDLANLKYLQPAGAILFNSANTLSDKSQTWKSYVPAIALHTNNQFHDWFFGNKISNGIINGDFGKSYLTGKPVTKVISEKIFWSLLLSVGSILLAYILSIPLAVLLIYRKNKLLNSITDSLLSFFYATPVYLLGVLLIFVFSNPEMLNVFPSGGVKPTGGYTPNTTTVHKFFISIQYLTLPLICYTYGTFAFLTRTLSSVLGQEMKSDYIRTARAKGLSEFALVFNHALRNSLLPLVAVFANLFPAIIGGSLILETMFTIPGMGFETYMAVINRNYPIVIAVFAFSGLLTITGYLITDFISTRIDPRITFNNQ